MYIRETTTANKKTGETYTKYQLVESYRSENGPRQRIIMTLTELDLEKKHWPALANAIAQRLSGTESLFEKDPLIARYVDLAMTKYDFRSDAKGAVVQREQNADYKTIDLSTATTASNRSLGPEIVASSFYESLGFGEILAGAGISDKDCAVAKAVILARLIHPGSDLGTHKWIQNVSSLSEFTGIEVSKFHKDKVYEIADVLYVNKDKIERGLYQSASKLFPTTKRLFLFDLTNAYFEGNAKANHLAKYGHSKEKRYDCALVSLALVVDHRGLPVYSEIYEGNISEPRTLDEVLNRLIDLDAGTLFSEVAPTIVMDRGIATKTNIALLADRGFSYVVIERANKKSAYKEHFIEMSGFTEITDAADSQVSLKRIETNGTTVVLCKSEGRKAKETQITAQAKSRFLEDLASLSASIQRNAISKTQKVAEKLGRIKSKYPGVAATYEIDFIYHENHGQIKNGERFDKVTGLVATEKPSKVDKELLAECYVIDTTHGELDAKEIWQTYMTLTKVEDAFRALKSDLGLRPIYHQLARRTAAHLFISVLAYHLLSAIELTLRQHDDMRKWSTINKELSTHMRNTMVLTNASGVVYHLRVSSLPEPNHKEIYRILGVRDPLRRQKRIAAHL